MKKTITKSLVALALAMPICASAQTSPVLEWAQQVGRPVTPCNNTSYASAVDAAGNVYTTGRFQDTTDFDPGAGTTILTPVSAYNCTYVNKTAPDGSLIWAKHFTGVGDVFGRAIAVDDTGNVYITGSFTGNIDFDPGAGTDSRTSAGGEDYFRVTLNSAGNFISVSATGGAGQDLGTAIATDHSGSWFVSLESAGSLSRNTIISKVTSGVSAWNYTLTGSADGYCYGGNKIAIDAAGNIYVTGFFRGRVNFNSGGSTFLTSASSGTGGSPTNDIYILKITASGVFAWVKAIQGPGTLQGTGIAVDAAGSVYATGAFAGTSVDFDPGSGTAELTASATNGYILKLTPDGDFKWVKQVSSGSFSYTKNIALDDMGNVYASGEFRGTYSLPWASVGPISGGSATSDGYIVKLDTAGNYKWNGTIAVSSSTKYLQLSSISVTGGGNIYATCTFSGTADLDPGAGTASFTSGSDADLGLIKLKQCFLSDAVTLSGTTISATMTGASYQWIDCAGNTPIGGATAQNFTPTATGSYAVIVSNGACADTSVCTTVTIVGAGTGIDNIADGSQIAVYPNPATNNVTIANITTGSTVNIMDIAGQVVYESIVKGDALNVNTANLPAGLYVVKVTGNNAQTTIKKLVVSK